MEVRFNEPDAPSEGRPRGGGFEVEPEVVESAPWEQILALGSLLLVAAFTYVVVKLLAKLLKGKTRFGLHGLQRLVAPLTLFFTALATWLALRRTPADPPLVELAIELLLIFSFFWAAARLLDVTWQTGRKSARLRRQPGADVALLAGRQFGKAALALFAVTIAAVRLGASEQLYLALGAIGAALTFAARAPISNALTFAEMMFNPPFRIGDQVRLGEYRRGPDAEGEVIQVTLSAVTIRTKRRTEITVHNALLHNLRIENLSQADRRRLELEIPIRKPIPAEVLRAACDVIEDDLKAHEMVSSFREPHVWISGHHEGLVMKASAWLKRASDRRNAQRDILLQIKARFEELVE